MADLKMPSAYVHVDSFTTNHTGPIAPDPTEVMAAGHWDHLSRLKWADYDDERVKETVHVHMRAIQAALSAAGFRIVR